MKPISHSLYRKGKGAATFGFSLPPEDFKTGTFFISVAEPLQNDGEKFNWDQKITIALSVDEVGKLLLSLGGVQQDFFHDRNMGTSKQGESATIMRIRPSDDNKVLFLNLSKKNGDQIQKGPAIVISKADAIVLKSLMTAAIPRMLGWT